MLLNNFQAQGVTLQHFLQTHACDLLCQFIEGYYDVIENIERLSEILRAEKMLQFLSVPFCPKLKES